jgi:guanidinobutyrase / D-arginase
MPDIRGPADALRAPRYAGVRTFARLPTLEQVGRADVAVLGAPFDSATSFRPGARFGPAAVRDASILLRPYHEPLDVEVFAVHQVVDAGDAPADPIDVQAGHAAIHASAAALVQAGARVLGIGGDHSVALPLMRAAAERHGPLSLIQFDAHCDTWDEYFGHKVTHGTIMRRAVEEGIVDGARSTQIGIRGPLYAPSDLQDARELGFTIVTAAQLAGLDLAEVIEAARARLGDAVYITVDIDCLDPAFAPGTGTPEPGGLLTRELQGMLRGLAAAAGAIVGGDVVEVSPPYDHANLTAAAGAAAAYELLALMALGARGS